MRILLAALFLPIPLAAQGNPNPVPRDPSPWPQHSLERTKPPVVTPGAFVSSPPPADAIVLMDGQSLDRWRSTSAPSDPTAPTPGVRPRVAPTARDAARWVSRSGYVEIAPGTGGIATRDSFGDIQLHVEWKAPVPAVGDGQHRGNSGVFLMGTYEVQVLDSYRNETYADGQAASLFGQFPPLVNAMRPPEEWQSYDIIFHRPRFAADGKLVTPGRLTVFHNGIVVQVDQELLGPTSFGRRAPYEAHPDRLPLELQDHGYKVRFRNIWVRRLE